MKTKFSKKIIVLALLALNVPICGVGIGVGVGTALAQAPGQSVLPMSPSNTQSNTPSNTPSNNVASAAQGNQPGAQPGSQPGSQLSTASAIGVSTDPGPSNLENNRTVLVREYEKKRLQLDIRKLEKEIEKLDEPAKTENQQNGPQGNSGSAQPYNPFNLPPEIQAQLAAGKKAMEAPMVAPPTPAPETRVYSIYGFETSLLAKLAVGAQGGYVVNKGDTLPDGRTVTDIKPNYVLISSGVGKKLKQERVFLSEPPSAAAATAPQQTGGNSGSANINPITGLGSMPGGGVFTPSTTRLPSMNVLNLTPPTSTPGAPARK